jgi:molybdopterin synthase sulfur carrier subunit
MEIQVKLFATLRKYLPPGAVNKATTVSLAEGATVADALERLEVPLAEAHLILVNGHHREVSQTLHSGDVVAVFPPVAGG